MGFENKTVIVTGAANGIGKSIATLYAEKGANVVIADVDTKAGIMVAEKLKDAAIFVSTDVRVESDIIHLMKTAFETYGKIDILVNNAGVSIFKSPYALSVKEWDDIINTNLRSVSCAPVNLQSTCVITKMAEP